FVIDLPQGGGKVSLQPEYVLSHTRERLILRNYQGHIMTFRNPGAELPVKTGVATQVEEALIDEDRTLVRS
ncbi:MAG: lysine 2,3-aminomutase, partial [Dehalococcoidales bacterium]|nr:lysine 2,3-aminomutase [Dehalococcoidales bacterium]